MNQRTKDFRKKIADAFVKSLEENELKWKKSWTGLNDYPENAVTGKKYNGINFFQLTLVAAEKELTDSRWATFKQIQDAGWKLQKGSKGTQIEYWKPYDFKEKKGISWETFKRRMAAKDKDVGLISEYYTVFNAQDIRGIPERIVPEKNSVEIDRLVDTLSQKMEVEIINDGGDRAYYNLEEDKIHLPEPKTFESTYDYNATALHELSHSTGSEHRLDRNMGNNFGSAAYAYEELVAEISSCFMGEHLCLEPDESHMQNHKAYVQSWIKAIKEKPETLMKAIKDASDASDYMELHADLIPEIEHKKNKDTSMEVPTERIHPEKSPYLKQIDHFYKGTLPVNAEIRLGKTPEVLQRLGAADRPLIITQKTLQKCIREQQPGIRKSAHQLSREVIEKLPEALEKPILITNEESRNSFAVICDCVDHNNKNILVAVQMEQNLYGKKVNRITSVYGKDFLPEYLSKFDAKDIFVIDKEKAKKLSPSIELCTPQPPINLDYDISISQKDKIINKNEIISQGNFRSHAEISSDIKKGGFQATKSLVRNIEKLDNYTNRENLLKDICTTYKNGCPEMQQEEKKLVEDIGNECKAQEMSKIQFPER